ncbi:cytochrome b/b6 domain-containing protein [Roseospira goensis]|uniref:Thiosulfate reductase cytochrome b subunit n=1 Tax=Roseospira goensis TaxID=391922 RepID=A0A7W6RY06_9PROT|nr:cytochrome b/b6 domain-containing protein [Roseospira goensis]MBB4285319.1 thiosulfate reductase cytochrome b subunit [Roseospira goensis]
MVKERVMVFSRFERFWHWSQAVLIIALMITGFEVNGAYRWLGYEQAAQWHRLAAWVLIGLWVFVLFWHAITGEWKQYIPTRRGILAVARYYTTGILDASVPHPYRKTRMAKHNPLQRLAYLAFNVLISPVIWISGLLYMFYNAWVHTGLEGPVTLGTVALVHTAAAFAMLIFFVGHVYLAAFAGKPFYAYLKAMITGYDLLYIDPAEDPCRDRRPTPPAT